MDCVLCLDFCGFVKFRWFGLIAWLSCNWFLSCYEVQHGVRCFRLYEIYCNNVVLCLGFLFYYFDGVCVYGLFADRILRSSDLRLKRFGRFWMNCVEVYVCSVLLVGLVELIANGGFYCFVDVLLLLVLGFGVGRMIFFCVALGCCFRGVNYFVWFFYMVCIVGGGCPGLARSGLGGFLASFVVFVGLYVLMEVGFGVTWGF